MQERGVRRIDADFECLQPVAADVALECEGVAVGRDETVDFREGRRFAFAEIGPENAALLDDRIGALLDAAAEFGILRLRRRLQALAGGVKQPAMKGATQPAVLEPAESKVGAAVGAVALDQAVASSLIAKQHEIFAEQFHRAHRPRPLEFVDERRRLPVHPHQSAARVFRPGTGDQVVLFLAHHGASPHPKKACDGRQSLLALFVY